MNLTLEKPVRRHKALRLRKANPKNTMRTLIKISKFASKEKTTLFLP
jgi:hypothetical protein